MKRILMVAAVAANGVIGNGPDIPWSVPGEQREFKAVTLGHTLLMGRTTYESIGRPLPGRTTIVLTRDPDWSAEGVLTARSLDDALLRAATLDGEIVVAGGARVYRAAMPLASELIVSRIPLEPDGDAHFPEIDERVWELTEIERFEGYQRHWYERLDR